MANGVVYVGSADGSLYAFNAATGRRIWSAAAGNLIESSPAVADGVVYVGCESIPSSPAVANGVVYVGSYGNAIYSSLAVANGFVYVGSGTGDGSLYCFGLPPASAAAQAAQPPARPEPATLKPDLTLLQQP